MSKHAKKRSLSNSPLQKQGILFLKLNENGDQHQGRSKVNQTVKSVGEKMAAKITL